MIRIKKCYYINYSFRYLAERDNVQQTSYIVLLILWWTIDRSSSIKNNQSHYALYPNKIINKIMYKQCLKEKKLLSLLFDQDIFKQNRKGGL